MVYTLLFSLQNAVCFIILTYLVAVLFTIKELMIMLPLHGQNTAALQLKFSGQAILQKLTRKDVFVKQANITILPNSSKEINIQ